MKVVVVHDAGDIFEPIEQFATDIDEEIPFLQEIDAACLSLIHI